jgi:3D (Asp-Asp-Asp) domain-containing protein
LLYSDVQRYPRTAGFPAATTAVAALAYLREQTLPQLIEPPRFRSRTRAPGGQPEWLTGLFGYLSRYAMVGLGIATLVLALATILPAVASFQGASSALPVRTVSSSAGVSGTAATRVESLGVATFVGGAPFIQQLRFSDALAGNTPPAARFVEGARQASIASYMRDVSFSLILPYMSDAAYSARSFESWASAVEANRRAAAVRSATVGRMKVFRGAPIAPGTRLSSVITFYACVGDGFCGNTASGMPVSAGSAACSSNLPFGTRFRIEGDPTGRVFLCNDRGALASTWVDVWFYSVAEGRAWQSMVGNRGQIIIVD